MESDADRLVSIKAAGGVFVRSAGGDFWAIFDQAFSASDFGLEVEGRAPALACRTSDVFARTKDEVFSVPNAGDYRVKRAEPDIPAPGWTTLMLKV